MTAGVHTLTTDVLPDVSDTMRARIEEAPRTPEAHRALMADVPAMQHVETGGQPSCKTLDASFTAIAWNVERCLFPSATADHMRPFNPDIVLLSEVDKGMARTGQKHTTAEVAEALGMTFAYGVEFFELDLGGAGELQYCEDDFNRHGWHGNALLSKAPPRDVALIRLDDDGHWFCDGLAIPTERRIGGRMAIAAILPTAAGDICAVSTHFESNSGSTRRDAQMRDLIDAIDGFAGAMPVLIGGDLNTGNRLENADWKAEALFETAKARGYAWDTNAAGMTTRPSLITTNPTCQMKLDWFASKGLTGSNARIVSSLDETGRPLSDHDMIVADFELHRP